jgi:hypothetical protein
MAKRTGRRVSRKRNTSRKYSKKRYSKKRYSKKRYSKRVSRKRYSKRVSRRKTKRKVMVGGESPNSDVGTPFRVLASSTDDSGRINKWVDAYTGYNLRKITVERRDGGSIAIAAGATKKSTGKNIHLKYYKDPEEDRGWAARGKFKFKLIPIDGAAAAAAEADLREELAGNKEWSVSTANLAARAEAAGATPEELTFAKSLHNMDDEFRDLIVRGELSNLKEVNFDADTAPERTAWMTAITNLKSDGQGATRGEGTALNQKYFSASGRSLRRDYLDPENDAINLARYSGEKSVLLDGGFEVRFGENLNTDYGRLDSEPPSRMWQVNTNDQNTRVVDVIPEPEPSPQTEPEPTHEGVAGRAGAKGEGAMVEPGGEGGVPVDDKRYYSIGRGEKKWPYQIPENTAINAARRSKQPSVTLANDQGQFEVRFAENGNTDWGQRGKPVSGMWQVNLNEGPNNGNIREVWEYPEAVTKPSMEDAIPSDTEAPPGPPAVTKPSMEDAIPSDTEAPPGPPIVSLGNEWDLFRGPLPKGDDIQGQGGIMMTLEDAAKKCSENSDAYGFAVQLVPKTLIGGQYKYNIWIKDNKNKDKTPCELMPGWQSFTKKEEKIWL